MTKTLAYAATDAASPLGPFTLDRREPGPRDVQLEILFCGVCHTDLHMSRNDWQFSVFPVVPGHEIVGRVNCANMVLTYNRPDQPGGGMGSG